jgi:hypothetical protein
MTGRNAIRLKIRAQSFTLNGEAVVCGKDGVAIFDTLHRHGTVRAAILKAFDLLELNGEDFRSQPLSKRKAHVRVSSAQAGCPRPPDYQHGDCRPGHPSPLPFRPAGAEKQDALGGDGI